MAMVEVHEYEKHDFRNTVAIIGFPSFGLVSSIAASYLARELKLELVAGMTSPDFPPYCIIQNGVPMPQIRMYSGCRNLSEDGEKGIDCDEIAVITSEFIPKPEQYYDIAKAIMSWLESSGIHNVIVLDGIPMFKPDTYEIIGAGSTDLAREVMKTFEIEPFDDGMVRGLAGLLLYEGSQKGVNVISLLGSAKSEFPDPKGAAVFMDVISRMLPEINIDTEPLYLEAEDLEKKLNKKIQPASSASDGILYG
ncbi:MAG: proteasome assembly chaperone family protein [Thermoplasmata archaeon]|nr:proteasome assembly chaperone family protein [Thermoplasmata archaeon]